MTTRALASARISTLWRGLPDPIDLGYVLTARSPFEDALVGDGNGSIVFTLPEYPAPSEYVAEIVDQGGASVATLQGRFAENSSIGRPVPLVQRDGFQLLEGDGINIAKLNAYSSSGELMKSTPVSPAHGLVSSVDVGGGSLVVSHVFPPGGTPPGPHNPWILTAQRFDEHGVQRGPARAVAGDPAGQSMVTSFAGAVTTRGWMFMAWTAKTNDTPPVYNDLQGAWVNPSGNVSPPLALGSVLESGRLDVAALASGGVAVAAFSQASQRYGWLAQIHEGAGPSPAGWLDAFPFTRIAIARGGRAHAVLVGAPSWPGASAGYRVPDSGDGNIDVSGRNDMRRFLASGPQGPRPYVHANVQLGSAGPGWKHRGADAGIGNRL